MLLTDRMISATPVILVSPAGGYDSGQALAVGTNILIKQVQAFRTDMGQSGDKPGL